MLTVDTYQTLAEAAGQMNQDTRFLGGGTLVMRDVNYGASGFSRIVRSLDPQARAISASGNGVRIGAAVTMSQIIAHADTAALAPAARSVGGPAIRNMATVGGNLFAAHPYGDLATALLAADATVEWADGRSEPIATDAAGRFRIEHVGAGRVAVVAAADGVAPKRFLNTVEK